MEERKAAAAGCLATWGTNTEREIEGKRERETVNYWWDKEGALYLITAHTATALVPAAMPEK